MGLGRARVFYGTCEARDVRRRGEQDTLLAHDGEGLVEARAAAGPALGGGVRTTSRLGTTATRNAVARTPRELGEAARDRLGAGGRDAGFARLLFLLLGQIARAARARRLMWHGGIRVFLWLAPRDLPARLLGADSESLTIREQVVGPLLVDLDGRRVKCTLTGSEELERDAREEAPLNWG